MKVSLFPRRKPALITVVSFFLALSASVLVVLLTVFSRLDIEKLKMEQIILVKHIKASETLSRLLYKTQTLSVYAQNGYTPDGFERIAATLNDDPSIMNMLIAPDGIVRDVYPLEGNEAVVGFDFFSESDGNKEALLAKETGELVLGGPFKAVQGSSVIVGRLPVFTESNGEKVFWGLVSVTLKYPEALDAAGLNEVHMQGFDYEIWRINPDDGQKQTIAGSNYSEVRKPHYIEETITIQNAQWYFRIYPTRLWYEYSEIWIMLAVGIGVSVLIADVIQNNYSLKQLKTGLETLSNTDSLTGICNRRYFMECAVTPLERSERLGAHSAVIMMDIDHFKKINDRYGHLAGDKVLREIAATVQAELRPYDLFGRYGGEEFIILACDIDQNAAFGMAERIRKAVSQSPIIFGDISIPVTASFGIADLTLVDDLEDAIERSDQALYDAKRGGRNVVKMYKD